MPERAQVWERLQGAGLAERLRRGFERLIRQSEYVNEYRKIAPHDGPLLETDVVQNVALEDLFRKDSLRDSGLPKEFDGKDLEELSVFVGYLHGNYRKALTVWVEKINGGSAVEDPRITIISQLAQKALKNGA